MSAIDECNESRSVDFEAIKQIRRDLAANHSEFEDKNFPLVSGDRKMKWKRVKDLEEKGELFEEGSAVHGRIVPGKLGSSHFAIAISCIANHPQLLKYVFPEGQEISNPETGGFFYFRFWKMGRWVYVYIDDKLPFVEEKKSKSKSSKKDGKKIANEATETSSSTATSETNESRESKSFTPIDSLTKKESKKDEPRKSCVRSIGKSDELEQAISENLPTPIGEGDSKDSPCPVQEKSKSGRGSKSSQKVGLEENITPEKSDKTSSENRPRQMSFSYVAGENDEVFYWVSLLEKGYAKFCGGYRSLNDKSLDEILLDLTGGIVEDVQTSSNAKISFLDLKCHSDKHSLIIAFSKNLFQNSDEKQDILPEEPPGDNVAGYGKIPEMDCCIVTKIQFVDFRKLSKLDKMVGFVRLFDPIGSFKWPDSWIGAIEEWKLLSETARQELKMDVRNAHEWYLSYGNFLIAFSKIKVCTVPDGKNFNCEGYLGQWTIPRQLKEITDLDKLNLHKNPQHRICVRDPNEPDEPRLVVEIVTSLIIRKKCNAIATSGFWLMIYELDRPGGLPFDFDYFRFRKPLAVSNLASAARLNLQQGSYLAVLATTNAFEHPTTMKYLLRFAIPAKFHGMHSFPPTEQSGFVPCADSIDVTNYFDLSDTLEEEKSSETGEKSAKLRRKSEKGPKKEKNKGKKKKAKR